MTDKLARFQKLNEEANAIEEELKAELDQLEKELPLLIQRRDDLRSVLFLPPAKKTIAKKAVAKKAVAKKAVAKKAVAKKTASKKSVRSYGKTSERASLIHAQIKQRPGIDRNGLSDAFSQFSWDQIRRPLESLIKDKKIENQGSRMKPAYYSM